MNKKIMVLGIALIAMIAAVSAHSVLSSNTLTNSTRIMNNQGNMMGNEGSYREMHSYNGYGMMPGMNRGMMGMMHSQEHFEYMQELMEQYNNEVTAEEMHSLCHEQMWN